MRTTGSRPLARLSLRGLFGDRALGFGTKLEVRVTAPSSIGKVFSLRMRKTKAPARTIRCLPPGSNVPVRC